MRRLIINADDFGLTTGVNRGILEAHTQGVVTSATLMANGLAFSDAVRAVLAAPDLNVGCHAVLVDGAPVLDPSQVSSLLQGDGFRKGFGEFAWRALWRRMNSGQLEAEVTAQIRKIQFQGLKVSHVDTHKHTHMFSQVLGPLLRAARSCGVPAVRNPFELIQITQLPNRPVVWKRWVQVGVLHVLAGRFHRAVKEAGMLTPDGTLGIVATGVLDAKLFQSMVEKLPEGTWEFVCHPGYNDEELRGMRTRLKDSRAQELRLLTSAETREALARSDIELISYHDFAADPRVAAN